MKVKKQDLSGFEVAMLHQAFERNLFTKPNNGDIWSVEHKEDSGSTFYFKIEFYNQLINDMQFAYNQGKFAQSNANSDWINLMNSLISAEVSVSENTSKNILETRIEATKLEHVHFLQNFRLTERSTEIIPELAKQTIIKTKDELNRPLEEDTYSSNGELSKILFYKYLDGENIIEKRTIDLSGYIAYSFIHRYKDDSILEEWIFMGDKLSSITEWIYDESGEFVSKRAHRG